MIGFRAWPKYLFSRDRMKVIQRFLNYQKKEFQRIRLGVFELALLIEKAWSIGLDSEEIDVSLNYYEAKRVLEAIRWSINESVH